MSDSDEYNIDDAELVEIEIVSFERGEFKDYSIE